MPADELAAAFEKLKKAQNRLVEIQIHLRAAYENTQEATGLREFKVGDRQYNQLQVEWDEAFSLFKIANTEFSDAVHRLHDRIERERRAADSS